MKLIRYDHPQNLLSDWDRLFADSFRAFAPLFAREYGAASPRGDRSYSDVEWYEDDGHYYARIELPGVRREDLKLDAEDGLLRLSFEVRQHRAAEGREESREQRYERVLRLPDGVDLGGVSARLADGILDLTLPKAPEKRPVSVAIQ
jgi:HSP20 family protein